MRIKVFSSVLALRCKPVLVTSFLAVVIGGLAACAAPSVPVATASTSVGAPAATSRPAAALAPGPADRSFTAVAIPASAPLVISAKPGGWTSNEQLLSLFQSLAAQRHAGGAALAHLLEFGTSQNGLPLLALRLTLDPDGTPGSKPRFLLFAQQHGDEPLGAEALMKFVKLVDEGRFKSVLQQVDLVVVPRLNPDGAETGTRGNAADLDIDGDHLLLRSAEAHGFAQLLRTEDPVLVLELSELASAKPAATHGSPPLALRLREATSSSLPPFIARAGREWLREPLESQLSAGTSAWMADDAALASSEPDTQRNITGLRNMVSLVLVASVADERSASREASVNAEVDAVSKVVRKAAMRVVDMVKVRDFVKRDVSDQACRGMMAPGDSVQQSLRPCGYWLSANEDEAANRLLALGVDVVRLTASQSVLGDRYRSADKTMIPGVKDDAYANTHLGGTLIDMPADSYYISLSQPLANLAIAALQPNTDYGYFAAGILDSLDDLALLRSPLILEGPDMLIEQE